jgi:hypothetical protein
MSSVLLQAKRAGRGVTLKFDVVYVKGLSILWLPGSRSDLVQQAGKGTSQQQGIDSGGD